MMPPATEDYRLKAAASALFLLLTSAVTPACSGTVSRTLRASLETGSLAGTRILVTFSYDDAQVVPVRDSYVTLQSFQFTLFGVPFTRRDINQGGEVIFRDGRLDNVTASFQGVLPAGALVNNITFGFGGPGVIGYIDRKNHFGRGSFTFGPAVVHEGFVVDVRRVRLLRERSVEIELYSDDPFPVRDGGPLLQVGGRSFAVSGRPRGELNSLVFTLTDDEFAGLGSGDALIVQYGSDPADELWYCGDFNKKLLR